MYCVRYGEQYQGYTLSDNAEESRWIYEKSDNNAGWAFITGSAKVVEVSVIIVEKGSITL